MGFFKLLTPLFILIKKIFVDNYLYLDKNFKFFKIYLFFNLDLKKFHYLYLYLVTTLLLSMAGVHSVTV